MKSFTLYPIGTVKAEGETAALQLDAALHSGTGWAGGIQPSGGAVVV